MRTIVDRIYSVYIVTNKGNTTLYTGVTSGLKGRVWQHKNKVVDGFTKKYNINKLVYYENFEDVYTAIGREKQIKNLVRWNQLKSLQLLLKKVFFHE